VNTKPTKPFLMSLGMVYYWVYHIISFLYIKGLASWRSSKHAFLQQLFEVSYMIVIHLSILKKLLGPN
jgi:hypothetical protein